MLIDISNMGDISKENLHKDFLDHFKTNAINVSGTGDFKIAIDMWDYNTGKFALDKYDVKAGDYGGATSHTLSSDINSLNINYGSTHSDAAQNQTHTYIWINSAEQLKGVQDYKDDNKGSGILGYNFALKNDIDASKITDYKAIASGAGEAFTGHFDGRGNRVIGLEVGAKSESGGSTTETPSSAGIFGTIGKGGLVEDLKIYSSSFYGKDYAGAVAGINNGTIKGITTLGNHVEAFGSNSSEELLTNGQNGTLVNKFVGAAGGIAGKNSGSISDISASDSVVAGDAAGNGSTGGLNNEVLATAGGIAGINDGEIENVTSDSAVTANQDTTYSLGGVVGLNRNGSIDVAYNTGITHGEYGEGNITSNSVGGIAGVNTGSISNVYNGADITGGNYVGGIVGYNHKLVNTHNSGSISNAVNAGDILADFTDDDGKHYKYTGGLAGYNSGTIISGRNTGEIYGGDYVGGMVGGNAAGSELKNLSNSVFASITGEYYVGGIAGRNYGSINATDSTINNYGKVYGQHFVGGIAGTNEEGGVISNTISSISLHVKDENSASDRATYFGGVVGQNSGIIDGATNNSSVDVAVAGATNVGGIIGHNTGSGKLQGEIANEGTVSGKSNVGGIIGFNENDNILNNTAEDRLEISNSGRVSAADGGAAGIFYENTGLINNVDLINTGTVIGGSNTTSITGGLFGKNSGNITNSTLTNNGMVVGGGTVGGLIGQNSGNVSTSSLINSVNGTVIGVNNVGGLIGINTGTITGGRVEDEDGLGYYAHKIYNNGIITAGTWNDNNDDGIVDANEITTGIVGTNIGGLFGTNSGTVTAAYNTGAINAGNSTNVGGIAGTNEGILDQVFNTVMVAEGSSQTAAVTGDANVGGIVGNNEDTGKISNAYNTTIINATKNAGGIAGVNNGTIDTVFTTTGTTIISSGNSMVNNGHVLVDDKNKNSANYGGFGFDANDDFSKDSDDGIWKIYDGKSLAMLKVFLTSAKVEDTDFVYNGKEQSVSIDKITSADNNAAYNNNNSLISFIGHKNAGIYDDWLYSDQIAAGSQDGSFNPNNLGYDIAYSDTIAKAKIDIDLGTVDRTYGNVNITGSTGDIKNDNGYGFTVGIANGAFTDEMQGELTSGNLGFTVTGDGALTGSSTGRVTNDADKNYSWSGEFTLTEELAKNYDFNVTTENEKFVDGKFVVTGVNNSHVNKAEITITVDDKVTVPGYTPDYSGTNINGVLVNGDKISEGDYHYGVGNSDLENQVGTHEDSIGIWIGDKYYYYINGDNNNLPDKGIFKNYDVTINMGDLTVTKEELPEDLPDKPDSRWDYLYKDAPFDRNKDFRERKAEINFVDGGMKV